MNQERTHILPEEKPRIGYYWHKKHDPSKGVTDYAYFYGGASWHTETGEFGATYWPLYGDDEFLCGADHANRPFDMFTEPGRFIRIEDPEIIQALREVRNQKFPEVFG